MAAVVDRKQSCLWVSHHYKTTLLHVVLRAPSESKPGMVQ